MSTLLYRIGKSAYGKPWFFIVGWLAVLGVILAGIGVNGIRVSNEMTLPGTPSQTVMDTLEKEFPAAAGGNASIVFTAPEGESLSDPGNATAIQDAVTGIYGIDEVVTPQTADPETGTGTGAQLSPEVLAQLEAAGVDPTQLPSEAVTALASGMIDVPGLLTMLSAQDAGSGEQSPAGDDTTAPDAGSPYGPLTVDGRSVPGVLVSADGSVAMLQITFTTQVTQLPVGVTQEVIDAADVASDGTGIRVLPADSLKEFGIPFGPMELIGLAIAAVVLIITLGSLVAAGLPILTALIGVGVGVGGTYALSSFIDVNSSTPTLAMMIGLAVGIDYALFIVNRQRRLIVREGLSAREAAARAVGTAGTAVFFAGLTVIIALCGLSFIGIGFLTVMAMSAAVTVALAVLIAVSLLPALLGLIGERICSDKYRAAQAEHVEQAKTTFAERFVGGLVRRRWLVIVGCVAALGVIALPMRSMQLDFPSGASSNVGTDSRDSYDAISDGFGPGFNGVLVAVAHGTDGEPLTDDQIAAVTRTLSETPGVALAAQGGVSENGEYVTYQVVPTTGPTDQATKDLIEDLRDPSLTEAEGVELGVTGFTAMSIDIAEKLSDVFPVYVGIIGLLSLVILVLVFRSIWVPVKATVGFLLSVLATFGATTAVFQWGWLSDLFGFDNGGPLISFMPIIVTGILFGLAMDYEMFLVSSMREAHVHGEKGRAAVRVGFDVASRVVVAAAIIMVSVFASFVFGGEIMIKQMGFALAFGVLVDAFVVRLMFVPAVMAVLGERAWWLPKWLDRILPNLDVEGERLLEKLHEEDPVAAVEPAVAADVTDPRAEGASPRPLKRKARRAIDQGSTDDTATAGPRPQGIAGGEAVKSDGPTPDRKGKSSAKKRAKKKRRKIASGKR